MAQATSFNELGLNVGDTYLGLTVERIIEDGRYVWSQNETGAIRQDITINSDQTIQGKIIADNLTIDATSGDVTVTAIAVEIDCNTFAMISNNNSCSVIVEPITKGGARLVRSSPLLLDAWEVTDGRTGFGLGGGSTFQSNTLAPNTYSSVVQPYGSGGAGGLVFRASASKVAQSSPVFISNISSIGGEGGKGGGSITIKANKEINIPSSCKIEASGSDGEPGISDLSSTDNNNLCQVIASLSMGGGGGSGGGIYFMSPDININGSLIARGGRGGNTDNLHYIDNSSRGYIDLGARSGAGGVIRIDGSNLVVNQTRFYVNPGANGSPQLRSFNSYTYVSTAQITYNAEGGSFETAAGSNGNIYIKGAKV